jgi:hypothetical protein
MIDAGVMTCGGRGEDVGLALETAKVEYKDLMRKLNCSHRSKHRLLRALAYRNSLASTLALHKRHALHHSISSRLCDLSHCCRYCSRTQQLNKPYLRVVSWRLSWS